MTWVCVRCGARNSSALAPCTGCGVRFGAAPGRDVPVEDDAPRAGRAQRWVPVLVEVALLNALFVLWRVVGHLALRQTSGAQQRGLAVHRLERALHLPSELALQRWALPHHDLVLAADRYYAWTFAPSLAVALVWLLVRRRESYARWRTVTVVFTAAALCVQLLPVAPPRLLPQLGFVDTALGDGTSVYGDTSHGLTDQLSSMPSVHVGWAVLVAAIVVSAGRSRWRWLAVLHPVAMTVAVTVSANHWLLDDVAAAGLLAVAVAGVDRLRRRRAVVVPRQRSADEPAPARTAGV